MHEKPMRGKPAEQVAMGMLLAGKPPNTTGVARRGIPSGRSSGSNDKTPRETVGHPVREAHDVRAVVAKTKRYEVRESGLVAGMANLIDRAQLVDTDFPAHGPACVARRGTNGVWYVTTPLGRRTTRRSATTARGLVRAVLAVWGGDEAQLREIAEVCCRTSYLGFGCVPFRS